MANSMMNPGRDGVVISPSDTVDQKFRSLWVGVAGDIAVSQNGTTKLYKNVPGGAMFAVAGDRVDNTNTTATFMVGITL